jgi:hypothetical protein
MSENPLSRKDIKRQQMEDVLYKKEDMTFRRVVLIELLEMIIRKLLLEKCGQNILRGQGRTILGAMLPEQINFVRRLLKCTGPQV